MPCCTSSLEKTCSNSTHDSRMFDPRSTSSFRKLTAAACRRGARRLARSAAGSASSSITAPMKRAPASSRVSAAVAMWTNASYTGST